MSRDAGVDQPAWARGNAFEKKPEGPQYGVRDGQGVELGFDDLDELKAHLDTGKGRLAWVWVPEHERLLAPEEVPELAGSLKKRRLIFAQQDEDAFRRSLLLTGILVLYAAYAFLRGAQPFGFGGLDFLVISVFAFLYFTARPWWEARKGRKAAGNLKAKTMAEEIPEARFELWMEMQKTPLSVFLMALLILVGAAQFFIPDVGNFEGIREGGLDKVRYAQGERWRLFTAAFLHGNLIHFILNASALWYLGRRVEILARWPQLAGVFFLGILGAGWATVEIMPNQLSVGISGVVCGLLGFLLVFETLHRKLVPRPARRRLAAILISLVVIGVLGFRFIDNAAHFGGLATGVAYALVVFPKSSSPHRPAILLQDYLIGGVALVLISASALGALAAMIL